MPTPNLRDALRDFSVRQFKMLRISHMQKRPDFSLRPRRQRALLPRHPFRTHAECCNTTEAWALTKQFRPRWLQIQGVRTRAYTNTQAVARASYKLSAFPFHVYIYISIIIYISIYVYRPLGDKLQPSTLAAGLRPEQRAALRAAKI